VTEPLPRSRLSVGLGPELRGGRLAALAAGRTLVIGFVTARLSAGGWRIGDLVARWSPGRPSGDVVALAPIDGVALGADRRLLDLLAAAGPTIRLGGLPFARHPVISLDRPELWLAFLDAPLARLRA